MELFTWKHRIISVSVTILVIGLFALVGYVIGRLVDNIPLLVMVSVLVSYPFSLWVLSKALKKHHEARQKEAAKE